MINVIKTQPAPLCLEKNKNSKSDEYSCEGVKEQLVKDFNNKCYICEEKDKDTIVEHFKSHRQGKNRDLMFDWNNLFLACHNCNSIKGANYDNILNCTDSSIKIIDLMEFKIDIPLEDKKNIIPNIEISSKDKDIIVEKTVELLNKIYNGTNFNNKFNARNTKKKIVTEIKPFIENLNNYKNTNDLKLKSEIIENINSNTPFTAFKIWILKRSILEKEFQQYFN